MGCPKLNTLPVHAAISDTLTFRNTLTLIYWFVIIDKLIKTQHAFLEKCPNYSVSFCSLHYPKLITTLVSFSFFSLFLQGLLLFLKIDPYSLAYWWRECLYHPYLRGQKRPLEDLLCKILWRSAKKDVLHQINIPSQVRRKENPK